jgi:hypothetical protein
MVCIDNSAWFLKALCCLSHFPLWWFLEPFLVIFLAEFWGRFLAGFLLGVMYEDFVPLWLVTLPPWTPLNRPRFGGFSSCSSSWHRGQDPRFPLIVSVSVRFFWWRGCSGGNPAIPEVSPQSMGWIGRSGDWKLRVDPRLVFLGVTTRPGKYRTIA